MSQEISAPVPELMDPPAEPPQMNHGRTFAGWFLFWIGSLGMLIVAIGAIQYNWTTIWVGAAISVVGLIGSGVLRVMGHGQPRKDAPAPTVEDL